MRAGRVGRRIGLGWALGVLLGATLAGAATAPASAQEVDAVLRKLRGGQVTMGYRETIMPTSFLDDKQQPAGYAVEFCRRILDLVRAELQLPELRVSYVPVTLQTRQALVANGTVDIECGGTVNTFSRNKQVDFTPVTFVAASQLLVLKASGIRNYADLNGKVVAVATSGSSEPEIRRIMEAGKLTLRILPVDDHAAALIAVESRRADAYFSDNSAFMSLVKSSRRPDALAIVGDEYGYSPQGFMVPKNNPTFLWAVNKAMARMFGNGEAEALFVKWFGPYGLQVGPKLRAAWETASLPE